MYDQVFSRQIHVFVELLTYVAFYVGCIEVSIMHPLDLVKTRFQVQSSTPVAGHHHYTSIAHCMKTMYHTEGVFSFW
jgi:hypothetical protein